MKRKLEEEEKEEEEEEDRNKFILSSNGKYIDCNDDGAWRDLGRYNQLYKYWLIRHCTLAPQLEGILELILIIHRLVLSNSLVITTVDLYDRSQPRSYCLYNTPIRFIRDGMNIGEMLCFKVEHMFLHFMKFREHDDIFTTFRCNPKVRMNIDSIETNKDDWMIYDYLLMLSEKGSALRHWALYGPNPSPDCLFINANPIHPYLWSMYDHEDGSQTVEKKDIYIFVFPYRG